jgi:hypothetical protein
MSNFWDRNEMNDLMTRYRDMHDIDIESKSVSTKPNVCEHEKDLLYNQIHEKHLKMAEVVSPKGGERNKKDRCYGCVTKLWETMMFNWNVHKNNNSFGFFYRTATNYTRNYVAGRIDGSKSMFVRQYTSSEKIIIEDSEIPDGIEAKEYAKRIAEDEHGWMGWKLKRNPKDTAWWLINERKYNPYTSTEVLAHQEFQDVKTQTFSTLLDSIDWQILSEYIPDVDASKINRELSYLFLEVMKELIEDHPDKITTNRSYLLCLHEIIKSRIPIHVSRDRIQQVRRIVRQAYKYYAADFIHGDEQYLTSGKQAISYNTWVI